ncbi:hypothetical protein [Acrocarpospora sp. B8E8]|uniref:hypothetical protein n=1 Tax=Acrocarpospora sp. B8E8 TaxID=3153572 RepID=UPI00325FB587
MNDERIRRMAKLRAILEEYSATRDALPLFDKKTTKNVTKLVATLAEPADDVDAAYTLGWFHWLRYEHLPEGKDRDDLNAAVTFFGPVFSADPTRVPDDLRAYFLRQEASIERALDRAAELLDIHQLDGDLAGIEEATALLRQIVAETAPQHRHYADRLSDLGTALRLRHAATGDRFALAEALEVSRMAIAAPAPPSTDRAPHLSNLGRVLVSLYHSTKVLHFIVEAAQVSRTAVELAPDGHPDRGTYLSNLSNALTVHYNGTGNTEVLREALDLSREALAATPAGHIDYEVRRRHLESLQAGVQR